MAESSEHQPPLLRVQMRDFTSRFTPAERRIVDGALEDQGFLDVLHAFTEDGNADFYLFTAQADGPRWAMGKGRGQFFIAAVASEEFVAVDNDLNDVLDKLPPGPLARGEES